MEFLWSSEHGCLYFIPKLDSGLAKAVNDTVEFLGVVFLLEMIFNNRSEDLFDRGRQGHIEDEEMTFGSVRNIILTTTWLLHSSQILKILDQLLLTDT
jgi:hypothetical protein